MTAIIILFGTTSIIFFLLTFIALLNPLQVNVTANRWFSVFLFTAGCMLMNSVLASSGSHGQYVRLIAFGELSRFAMAPALYLSVLHYASPDKRTKLNELWHFVPFILFFICMVPVVFGYKPLLLGSQLLPHLLAKILEFIIVFMIKGQLLVYWLLSWFQLKRHRQNIELVNSDVAPVSLNWLRQLLLGIGLMILLFFADSLHLTVAISPWAYFLGSLFTCYFLLAQREVYPFEEPELQEIEQLINVPVKSSKQRLANREVDMLKARLSALMENEKVYLDPELDLPTLASQMHISIHDLSYLLNEGFEMNFFRFVNTYRVQEAKQLMSSEKYRHLNILGIAYSAGFNSKSTFNTAFKREAGVSPSQFIQQIKEGGITIPTV